MSNPDLQVVPLRTSKVVADEEVVRALESLLERAKEGQINALVVVGIDAESGDTHRMMHRACNTTLIGALSATLGKLQQRWNDNGEDDPA